MSGTIEKTELSEEQQTTYGEIIQVLCNYAGVDITQYKGATVLRRIQRRMGIVKAPSLEKYLDILLESGEEKINLYQDILIGVTEFFRDRDCFIQLYDKAVKNILQNGRGEIRIWSVACSTGEEAYSLAILLRETIEKSGRDTVLKIFATDLDKDSIYTAQQGIYRRENLQNIDERIIMKYFEPEGEFYRVRDNIRKSIVFAQHDVLKDAPFSRMDLIVCRNMFIYIKSESQKNILVTFYKSLLEGGYLFLGNSETLGKASDIFRTVDKKSRIYQKDESKKAAADKEYLSLIGGKNFYRPKLSQVNQNKMEDNKMVERILQLLTESTVLVGENGEVLRLKREEEPAEKASEADRNRHIRLLEKELQDSYTRMQTVAEELEFKNEELQSANEQMLISNEELQSANEEMQSVNEELYTVNSELQEKIKELVKANADFDNLLLNAEIGALYIDSSLRIRKITPIMGRNTNLMLADTGRPVTHVQLMEGYHNFTEDVQQCMTDARVIEREVDVDGIIWMVRLRPYFMQDGVMDGVIVTLFDVTKRLEAAKYELNLLTNSVPGGVAKMRYDNGLIIEYANDVLFDLMQITRQEMVERYHNHYELLMYSQDWSAMQRKIRECIDSGKMLQMEYPVHSSGHKQDKWRMMQAVVLERGNKPVLQCVIIDITATRLAYMELDQERKKLDVIARLSGDLLFEYDVKNDCITYTKNEEGLINPEEFWNNYTEQIKVSGYIHPEDKDALEEFCDALIGGKQHIRVELRKLYEDNQYHWVRIEGTSIYNDKGEAVKVIGKTENIDESKKRELEFRERSEKDSLTGLLNHMTARRRIDARLKNLKSNRNTYLLVADIDNFKRVNDTNGHLFGDAVLCTFSDKLHDLFPNAIKGRIGGDEFILYEENISREEIENRLERMNEDIRAVYQDDVSGLTVSCSSGLVLCDGSIKDLDILFQWADFALYQVKRERKGNFNIIEAKQQFKPERGYLTENSITDDYVRKNSLIGSAEELVLFTLELLDNVADIKNGIKMASDRICRFFHFDDIVFIQQSEGRHEKAYHWSSREKRHTDKGVLGGSREDWDYIAARYDSQGVMVLRQPEMVDMEGVTVGSIMFVKAREHGYYKGSIAYVDREKNRDWKAEREVLYRLAGIIFNRLQHMYETEKERRETEQQLNYDTVTRLPQYFKFMELAQQYKKENPDRQYFFVYSDFSNFQYLNEMYGYTAGDRVLKQFAEELQENCRGGIYFTRVTSDHFICMLSGEDMQQLADEFAELSRRFCDNVNGQYDKCSLLLISGMAKALPEHETISAMLDCANIARKYAKDRMESTVMLYTDEIKEQNEAEKSIVANMMNALDNGEYVAYLQPKISLETGKIVGAEALVRWVKADGTLVYPDKFIPIFEKSGFISKVDFIVLDQVLEYLGKAIEQGEEVVPVSVNFSRRHNEEPDFVSQLVKRLEKYKIPRGFLEAEVTESIFMMDLSTLKENIDRLHENGVGIAIDDFGSGYSSLNVLANVPADVIKLDKRFLEGTGDDGRNPGFIKYLIRMMKHMGMTIVAEGVETQAQVDFLKSTQCDMVQGYYYARPMPLKQFREFLKQFNGEKC